MRFLITGAAGFIGSHLCRGAVAEGHDVVGVDDLSEGSLENLAALLQSSAPASPVQPPALGIPGQPQWPLSLAGFPGSGVMPPTRCNRSSTVSGPR